MALSAIYSDILYGILSEIYSDIPSGILSDIYSDIPPGILSDNILTVYGVGATQIIVAPVIFSTK